jgi:iron complex outermembrane receptor protein
LTERSVRSSDILSAARAFPIALVAFLLSSGSLIAQPVPIREDSPSSVHARQAVTEWPAPLNRIVSLDLNDRTRGELLDELTRDTGIRFSYSPRLIGADRKVHGVIRSLPLGDALCELLRPDVSDSEPLPEVLPAVAASDHVVLAPVSSVSIPASVLADWTVPLAPLVVTGDPALFAEHFMDGSIQRIDSDRIESLGGRDLAAILRAVVPGFGGWSSFPAGTNSSTGLRGASSFSTSGPVVYLDGIQVADPLILSRIAPEVVENIEIVRGPAGAVLYGANAMDGVIRIRTRRAADRFSQANLQMRSTAGITTGSLTASRSLSQDHALTGWLGSSARSVAFALSGGTGRGADPQTATHHFSFTGNGQTVRGPRSLAATARLGYEGTTRYVSTQGVSAAESPWPEKIAISASDFALSQEKGRWSWKADNHAVVNYTVGTTATFATSSRWLHSIVAGLDGYRRTGADGSPDSSGSMGYEAAGGTGDLLSIRSTSDFRMVSDGGVAADLTFIGDYSLLRETETVRATRGWSADSGGPPTFELAREYGSLGSALYATGSYHDRLRVDAGVRLQTSPDTGAGTEVRALPVLNSSFKMGWEGIAATLHAGYGSGIRAPNLSLNDALIVGVSTVSLLTETQTGTEVGVDLRLGNRLLFGITRFDQRASSPISIPSSRWQILPVASELVSSGEMLGEISNRGWEFTSSATAGPFALDASLSTVQSLITRLPDSYRGNLQEGDRMYSAPAVTAGVGGSWMASRGSLSLTASRAWNWVGVNSAQYASGAQMSGESMGPVSSDGLREGWSIYDGAPRISASGSFLIHPDLSLLLGVDNLWGDQRGEPDPLVTVPGRSFSVGLRASF